MAFTMDASDISAKYDISVSRITRLRQDGKLVGTWKKRNKKFYYDGELFKQALDNNVSPQHRTAAKKVRAKALVETADHVAISEQKKVIKKSGLKIVSLAEAQEIKANYDAALKKLEYEQKNGELLEKAEVEKSAFETARRVRDSILNIPDRVGAELASTTDIFSVRDILIKSLNQALEELSS